MSSLGGSRGPRRCARLSSAALCLVGVSYAAAAHAGEPVRFEYQAPAECPSAATFEERVRERSLHVRVASEGELARTFEVAVVVASEGASASVEFVDGDGSRVSRAVKGATCDEVVSGIALVVALAIDARAAKESGAEAEGAEGPSPDAPAALPPEPAPGPSKRSPAAPVVSLPRGERRRVSAPPSWAPSAGLGVGVASHQGPSGALTMDAFFAAHPFSERFEVRASVLHFRSSATAKSGQEALFRGYGFRAEGCPWALFVRAFFAQPCAGVDLGALVARGVAGASLVNPRSSTRFWGQAELMSRLGVRLSGLVLEAQGELAVPFSSYRFGFGAERGGVAAFEVPRLGVAARAGAGVRF